MVWHRPGFLKNVGFLKGIVHAPRTPEQQRADPGTPERRPAEGPLSPRNTPAAASSSAALAPRTALPAMPAAVDPAARPQASSSTRPTVAQATAHRSSATPGLKAFLDQPDMADIRRTGVAIDLGAGGGRDTRALIRAGWTQVHAVDVDPHASTALRDVTQSGSAVMHIGTLRNADIPEGGADIVNAQRALPFIEDLPETLHRAHDLLRPGGILVASFFGPEHSWAGKPKVSVHGHEQVQQMLEAQGFEVIGLRDMQEANQKAANGKTVPMWHEIHVQARRK
jgi:SAM-dependent methyltransferase